MFSFIVTIHQRSQVPSSLSVQWNLLIRTPSGPAVSSFIERLSSFRGDFLIIECVYKSTFGLSFVRFILFWNVLYWRFHCISILEHTHHFTYIPFISSLDGLVPRLIEHGVRYEYHPLYGQQDLEQVGVGGVPLLCGVTTMPGAQ